MNPISLPTEHAAAIVIFGASGDLTQRKLVPALHTLVCERLLSPAIRVVGVARTPLSDQAFRDRLRGGVDEYARITLKPGICELWDRFAGRHSYLAGSYDDPQTYRRLAERLRWLDTEVGTQSNRLFYLAIPPVLYPLVVEQLGQAGLNRSDPGWMRDPIVQGRGAPGAPPLASRLRQARGQRMAEIRYCSQCSKDQLAAHQRN